MPLYSRLLFFTRRFPYGVGECWKRDDLVAMAPYFEEVVVIPEWSDNAIRHDFDLPSNVRIEEPILGYCESLWDATTLITTDWHRTQLAELARQISSGHLRRIGSCLAAIEFQRNFLSECRRRNLFNTKPSETVLYFFWGRRAAEILPIL
jgi:hypothetical protein